jgi:hypothetical protein
VIGVLPCQVNTLRRSDLSDSTRLSSTSLFCKGGREREVRIGGLLLFTLVGRIPLVAQ